MELLLLIGIVASLVALGRGGRQPLPQIIYVQAMDTPAPRGTGCLPLVIVVGIFLLVLFMVWI